MAALGKYRVGQRSHQAEARAAVHELVAAGDEHLPEQGRRRPVGGPTAVAGSGEYADARHRRMIIRGGLVRNSDRSALRLLHYWWPLALGWSLTVVVQRATGREA